MEFYAAGLEHRERLLMAANQCITPWTYVQMPGREALSAEVWTSETPDVRSWVDGSECDAQARGGFFRGIEPAFRIVLGSGRFFDCSRKHQVLTAEGWLSLDQLVSRASGLRCWHKLADYLASCDADGYLGGQPLRSVAGIDLKSPQPLAYAQTRAPLMFAQTDEVAHILRRIRSYPQPDRLSNRDDLRRYADLFALFSGASTAQSVLPLSESTIDVSRLALSLGREPQEDRGPSRGQQSCDALHVSGPTECHDGPCMRPESCAKRLSGAQWCDAQDLGGSLEEWLRDADHMPIFYPSVHPLLVGGETIIAIVPLGLQPIIDAHIPGSNNYLAGGVVHHNCGKTFAGAFEVAMHLTGRYPDWWPGYRYGGPVDVWAGSNTSESTRDTVQANLIGPPPSEDDWGKGAIPKDALADYSRRQGVANALDTVLVRHVSGGLSSLGFKSYDQGRQKWQGTRKHLVWFDEEPPLDIYTEGLTRTNAVADGRAMITFTPLMGMSEVVLLFMADQ